MPVAVTYPGVYIEEIPSGVRTITGVATSITAFLGRASAGPINEPVTINSFADFERRFGGLDANRPLGYAVRDFYMNGGSTALIVRLFRYPAGPDEATATLAVGGINLAAASPGLWGRKLRASIDAAVADDAREALGLAPDATLFNLTVRLGSTTERFLNLNFGNNGRRIDRVLESESSLVRLALPVPDPDTELPLVTTAAEAEAALKAALTAGDQDAIDTARTNLDEANAALTDLATQKDVALAAALKSGDTAAVSAAKAAVTAAETAMKGSEGDPLTTAPSFIGSAAEKTGLYALDRADLFNLLCIPPDTRDGDVPIAVYQEAMAYCAQRRAMLIVDPPTVWDANRVTAASTARDGLAGLSLGGPAARNAALYFPRLLEADPKRDGQINDFVPCGAVAGIMARTDSTRGVWKAPAGLDAAINGIQGFTVNLNDAENGMLNPLGINCLRAFPVNGRVVWGARTLRGADQLSDEYKYVSVRRTALFIEESLYRGTQWVVFEPNDEPLWSQIRLNVGAFMNGLFRQGAFQGKTPAEAYFVKCDKETTPQNDINLGIVNIVVGFAPLKPAEFVIVKLQQIAGQIQV
jgi:Bacteriophage tail sheath protein